MQLERARSADLTRPLDHIHRVMLPGCPGAHRLRPCRGGPPFVPRGQFVLVRRGVGRAQGRCHQVKKASFQGQPLPGRPWRPRLAHRERPV